jgi:hypothetical protein
MEKRIEILEKKIKRIDVTTRKSVIIPETINGMVQVRFLLKGIFDCSVALQWEDEYESDKVLGDKILAKIFNEL